MTVLKISELIDLAIGSPEPGHVNFAALQCLLYSFAEKMKITNDMVDLHKYSILKNAASSRENLSRCSSRLISQKKRSVFVKRQYTSTSISSSKFSSDHSSSGALPSPPMPRALAAIMRRRFPDTHNGRLTGGADEPPAAEDTSPDAEVPAGSETAVPPAETEGEPPLAEPSPEQPPAAEAESPEAAAAPPIEDAPVPPAEPIAVLSTPSAGELKQVSEEERSIEVPPEGEGIPDSWLRMGAPPHGMELTMNTLPEELRNGIAIMKDQLELAMEELNVLTTLMINNKVDPQRLGQLRLLAARLRAIQRDNVFIEGTYRSKMQEKSTDWLEAEMEGEGEEEGYEEALVVEDEVEVLKEEEKASSTHSGTPSVTQGEQERYDLGLHVCYSPDKVLDQIMELKSEICALTNKVNEIAAELLKHDSRRQMMILHELQEQMKEFKQFAGSSKDLFDRLENDRLNSVRVFDELRTDIINLQEKKIDKAEAEVLLAEKVDYQQLARKANLEQLHQLQCRMERQFCEVNKLICLTERGIKAIIEEMRTQLGFNAIENILKKFKEGIDADICALAQKLQKYVEATNDDCAAAGGRVKVMPDLACISCDTECVMRTVDRSKVAKLKSAHQTNTIAPLVTYELSSIRKSGVMGYYRKDEFPSSPNAWLDRQGANANMKMCVPRHAGGAHTTYTAKERVEKITMQRRMH